MGLVQLPIFRAAADGDLVLLRVDDPGAAWPAKLIARNRRRPTCFMIGADPGTEYPAPPPPSEWVCARRLRYWCQSGGAIIHGAGGELDHYREAVRATLLLRRLLFVETTSHRVNEWVAFLGCRKTLAIRPSNGSHPVAAREAFQ
jgi:hypothetical protein